MFGWTDASFQVGLTLLGSYAKHALGSCIPLEAFFNATVADIDHAASPPTTPEPKDRFIGGRPI